VIVTAERHGPDRFLVELVSEGIPARREGPAIIYVVVPATGALAGLDVDTAVSVSELQSWPTMVPHWLHFPEAITFSRTNTDAKDCLPGWIRHSRDIGQWDTSAPPVRTWLAHVRGVLSTATRAD
jgi:hypothetical protein